MIILIEGALAENTRGEVLVWRAGIPAFNQRGRESRDVLNEWNLPDSLRAFRAHDVCT